MRTAKTAAVKTTSPARATPTRPCGALGQKARVRLQRTYERPHAAQAQTPYFAYSSVRPMALEA